MRLVIDTDVLVAAMRSPKGASAALFALVLDQQAVLILSATLALEYEATCTRPIHLTAAQLTEEEAVELMEAIIDVAELAKVHYKWRPQLLDPGDELVLEAAVNGGADAIVTFNRKDYAAAPARFGIELLSPAEVLQRIRTWRQN